MAQAHARLKPKPHLPKRLSTREFRERAEAVLESMFDQTSTLIALLDSFDGDENLEDNGDLEPSLNNRAEPGLRGPEEDLEDDGDDREPSLASRHGFDQTKTWSEPQSWGRGSGGRFG